MPEILNANQSNKSLPFKGGARRPEGLEPHPDYQSTDIPLKVKFGLEHHTFPANIKLVDRSKTMAKRMTPAEKIMWFEILKKTNLKWIKQKIIGSYVVDFFAFSEKLVIEVDGKSHNDKILYDKQRTDYLKSMGIKVARYSNIEVINNKSGVFEDIQKIINSAE